MGFLTRAKIPVSVVNNIERFEINSPLVGKERERLLSVIGDYLSSL